MTWRASMNWLHLMPHSHDLLFNWCALQSLKGRIMAVDWAVSKHTFQTGQPDPKQGASCLGTITTELPAALALILVMCVSVSCVLLTVTLRGHTCCRRSSHTSCRF